MRPIRSRRPKRRATARRTRRAARTRKESTSMSKRAPTAEMVPVDRATRPSTASSTSATTARPAARRPAPARRRSRRPAPPRRRPAPTGIAVTRSAGPSAGAPDAPQGPRQQDRDRHGVAGAGEPAGRTQPDRAGEERRGPRRGRAARATPPSEPSARHLRVDRYAHAHGTREDAVHPGSEEVRDRDAVHLRADPSLRRVRRVRRPRRASTTPRRPSGGNRYDRRVCDGLAAAGWDVRRARRCPARGPGPTRRPCPAGAGARRRCRTARSSCSTA